MENPRHSVIPITADDIPILAKFMFESQLQQATNRFVFLDWPNKPLQVSLYLKSLEQLLKVSNTQMFKVIGNTSSDVVGSVVLTRNFSGETDPPTTQDIEKVSSIPDGMNVEFRALVRRALVEVQKAMAGIDHFGEIFPCSSILRTLCSTQTYTSVTLIVLSSIFIKASSRSKGMGTQLVQLCLEKAHSADIPLFLASVPSAYGFYRKLGFRDTTYVDIDLSAWAPEYSGFGTYRLSGLIAE